MPIKSPWSGSKDKGEEYQRKNLKQAISDVEKARSFLERAFQELPSDMAGISLIKTHIREADVSLINTKIYIERLLK